MKTKLLCLMSIVLLSSCNPIREIGDVNMVSSRNIESKAEYILLRSYMGGTKKEALSARKYKILTIEGAINKVVKETPGGEFLKNVKVYLVNNKYIAVEGDVWGLANVKENYRGFSQKDYVLYKPSSKVYKGYIVALKDDKKCFFQEFGTNSSIEVEYKNLTKANFTQDEIDNYNKVLVNMAPEQSPVVPLKVGDRVNFQKFGKNQQGVVLEIRNYGVSVDYLDGGGIKKNTIVYNGKFTKVN